MPRIARDPLYTGDRVICTVNTGPHAGAAGTIMGSFNGRSTIYNVIWDNPPYGPDAINIGYLQKEDAMSTEQDRLELEAQRLQAQLERIREKQVMLDSFPQDDFNEGDVIWFELRLRPDGQFGGVTRPYTYSAIKTNGTWYTTGPRSPKNYTWSELVSWWARNELQELWKVTELERLI